MESPKLSLLVLRAVDPAALAKVYALLGCVFRREQHGAGPEHFSAALGGLVLEIYPRAVDKPGTAGVRLGFEVADLDATLAALQAAGVTLVSLSAASPWGLRAVVVDSEGHRIELTQAG